MPAKKKRAKKPSAQEEQLELLRQILAELQTLNANFATGSTLMRQTVIEPDTLTTSDLGDDEELEEYE
ncbi:hypothetical protein [Candidatus Nitrososphaera gargensis]|uniref:hypothetical protein n=1 Tax=Candidatus Nitrososphaera gargensis TaxID=497727 RepID=UPI0011E52708|nr:hypothetical protein [Candidatus Nitrososphaera gargensis]